METFGGLTSANSIDYAINYDYNYDCGFVMVGPNPEELEYFSVTTGEDIDKLPSITNAELEETYTIFVDIQTKNDYLEGGVFLLQSLSTDF